MSKCMFRQIQTIFQSLKMKFFQTALMMLGNICIVYGFFFFFFFFPITALQKQWTFGFLMVKICCTHYKNIMSINCHYLKI
jgi:hypothetical protein